MKKNYLPLLLMSMSISLFFTHCSPGQIHNIHERNKIKEEYGLKPLSDAQRQFIVQKATDSLRQIDPSLIFVSIPNRLHIKDKVIVTNQTPYPIKHIVITIINDNGRCKMLGQRTNIDPGISQELLSLDGNALKTIRKRTLVIKIKDTEVLSTNMNSPDNSTFDQRLTTHQYNIKLSEQRHDLHIDVISNSPFDI